jgi:predicted ATPase
MRSSEGPGGLGQVAEAIAAVDKGLASADYGGEGVFHPELLRLKGEYLLRQAMGRPGVAAGQSFSAALRSAHRQGALALELRAALSLARLRVTEGRRSSARQILAPVYDRFTEGFGTADLRAARGFARDASGVKTPSAPIGCNRVV